MAAKLGFRRDRRRGTGGPGEERDQGHGQREDRQRSSHCVTAGYAAATRCEALERALHNRVKHALLRIGAVGLASGLTAVVLLGIGRVILIGDLGIALPSFSQPGASASQSPRPTVSPAVLSDIATPNPSPATTATPEPSPAETP